MQRFDNRIFQYDSIEMKTFLFLLQLCYSLPEIQIMKLKDFDYNIRAIQSL